MDSKILGIPVVLIVLVLAIVLLVNLPNALFQRVNMGQFKTLVQQELQQKAQLNRLEALLKPEPTATPEASLTPEPTKFIQRVVLPTATPTK